MRLLSTDRAELHEFVSPEAVPGAYAILSHVWDNDEQTLQETRRLQDKCAALKLNPRDHASPKIRGACALAEEHGYDWLWVDAPCIDKSSSAEVSEAINSMYWYYSLAEVCYAYLKDVSTGDVFDQPTKKEFKDSRWHQRGWTLQELIAPRIVIFLSRDWRLLGTKAELADLIEGITRIPASLLRLETQMARFSIAQRMSWAANRQTTRQEDEAYCLLGIFGIQMPALYGEGMRAFYRLQEEIMRRFPDTTLFAWQPTSPAIERSDLPTSYHYEHSYDTHLFAPSPSSFYSSSKIQFSLPAIATPRLNLDSKDQHTAESNEKPGSVPTFSVTPYGVLAHIPVIDLSQYMIAILFWCRGPDDHLGLRLNPCSSNFDSSHPLYDVHPGGNRIVSLGIHKGPGSDFKFTVQGQSAPVVWKKIYIAHRPPPDSPTPDANTSLYLPLNLGVLMPFRFPGHNIQELYSSTGLRFASVSPMTLPWTGSPPITLTFQPDSNDRIPSVLAVPGIDLHLGRCTVPTSSSSLVPGQTTAGSRRLLGPHWARLVFHAPKHDPLRHTPYQEHSCAEDHICDWGGYKKAFYYPPDSTMAVSQRPASSCFKPEPGSEFESSIFLSFTPCPLNPSTTLVVNITTEDPCEPSLCQDSDLNVSNVNEHDLVAPSANGGAVVIEEPTSTSETAATVLDQPHAVASESSGKRKKKKGKGRRRLMAWLARIRHRRCGISEKTI